ncbi:MAG: hypothetical protein WCK77_20935 [Verrucomicrobiota bacterium]
MVAVALVGGGIAVWLWFGQVQPEGAASSNPENNQTAGMRVPATRNLPATNPNGPYASSRSRFSGTLSQGPDAIKAALESVTTPDEMREETAKLFNEAALVARTSGNFGLLANLFGSVNQMDRYLLGLQLPTVFSKLGPIHDIGEKLAIIEQISVPKTQLEDLRRKIYQMEAMERYDAMKSEGVVGTMTSADFSDICGALGRVRLGKAFERAADGGSEEAQRAAASALGVYAMRAGTMEGSQEIAKLPPGMIRDEAAAELVIWLKETGSKEDAQSWLESITDAQARKRATR